jgi:hypothetical protein
MLNACSRRRAVHHFLGPPCDGADATVLMQ